MKQFIYLRRRHLVRDHREKPMDLIDLSDFNERSQDRIKTVDCVVFLDSAPIGEVCPIRIWELERAL